MTTNTAKKTRDRDSYLSQISKHNLEEYHRRQHPQAAFCADKRITGWVSTKRRPRRADIEGSRPTPPRV